MHSTIDQSSKRELIERDRAIASYRKDEGHIKPNGVCHYCLKVVEKPKLFCNGDCATKFDKHGPCEY